MNSEQKVTMSTVGRAGLLDIRKKKLRANKTREKTQTQGKSSNFRHFRKKVSTFWQKNWPLFSYKHTNCPFFFLKSEVHNVLYIRISL